jgi:hypothetical protein
VSGGVQAACRAGTRLAITVATNPRPPAFKRRYAHLVVKLAHRRGDQARQTLSQPGTQHQPRRGTQHPEDQRLRHDEPKQLPRRHPDGAQTTQQAATLHDGKTHGVEDQEHPHQQGQQAHGRQVEFEGGGEAGHTRRGLGHRHQLHALREAFPQPLDGGIIQYQVHVAEPPGQAQNRLGRGDIHQQQILATGGNGRVNIQYAQPGHPVPVNDLQRITGCNAELPGGHGADHQRIGTGKPVADQVPPRRERREPAAKRAFRKQIQTDQPVTARLPRHPHPVRHHRCHGRVSRLAS